MTRNEKYDRLEMLEEAAEKIREAIDLIKESVEGTDVANSANAYIIAHLDNWAEGNNPYDQTIPVLSEYIENLDTMEDPEDE